MNSLQLGCAGGAVLVAAGLKQLLEAVLACDNDLVDQKLLYMSAMKYIIAVAGSGIAVYASSKFILNAYHRYDSKLKCNASAATNEQPRGNKKRKYFFSK